MLLSSSYPATHSGADGRRGSLPNYDLRVAKRAAPRELRGNARRARLLRSGVTFQQRSQRRPRAFAKRQPNAGVGLGLAPPSTGAVALSTISETMRRSARPAPLVAGRGAIGFEVCASRDRAMAPSRDDPMIFSRRASSRITEASSLNLVSRSQAGLRHRPLREVVQPVETRQVDRFFLLSGKRAQISSAVNGQDRRRDRGERARDAARGPSARIGVRRAGGGRVEAVLQDVAVESRERRRAEGHEPW